MKFQMQAVSIDAIHVDHSYQRPVNSSQVARIKKAFELCAIKAVSLSRRGDGTLWCYDGQHTIEAARAAGMKQIPAVIVDGSQALEAKWFLQINENGRRVSQRDKQSAGVTSGDDVALMVQGLLDEFGLQISRGGLISGKTNAIGAIRRYAVADVDRLRSAMTVIDGIWCNESEAWSGVVIRGMFEACAKADPTAIKRQCKAKKVTPRRVMDWCSARQTSSGSPGGGTGYACEAILTLAGMKD